MIMIKMIVVFNPVSVLADFDLDGKNRNNKKYIIILKSYNDINNYAWTQNKKYSVEITLNDVLVLGR